jgi:formylglycine-generating enzyme required for sulfatase activity
MSTGRRIFLAHAREDKGQVRELYADLKARGLDPWLDEIDMMPGQIWKQEIPKAIRQAGVLLACLSSRSVGKVGYVQNEFRLALSNFGERPAGSIFLIPVRLDDCDVPDLQIPDRGLSLRDIQWVDLWQEGGFDRLGRAIGYALAEVTNPRPASEKAEKAIPVAEPRDDGGMAPENAQKQVFIAEPPRREAAAGSAREGAPKRKAWVLWRHPTVMAAVIGAVGAVAAGLTTSPLLDRILSNNLMKPEERAVPGQVVNPTKSEEKAVPGRPPRLLPPPLAERRPPGLPFQEPPRKVVNPMETEEKAAAGQVAPSGTLPEIGKQFRDCDACPQMVAVPAGFFTMGSPQSEEGWSSDEGPQHDVTLPKFALSQNEVTFDEWDACVKSGGCNRYEPSDQGWGRGRRPVINVSWDDAKAYVAWLSKETSQPYRLLSEAEWEYAARAKKTTRYWWGNDLPTPEQANFGWNVGKTSEVGAYPANPLGLYDMNGNVWEWVEDCWHDSYKGAPPKDGSAWTSGDCSRRVLRGGSWGLTPEYLRSAFRLGFFREVRSGGIGFRVARTLG